MNVYSGQISDSMVNVKISKESGVAQMEEFEGGWPDEFHNRIQRNAKTFAETKRGLKVGEKLLFNMDMVYSRAMGFKGTHREVDRKFLLFHELSSVPISVFTDSGNMQLATKSSLKNDLNVEVTSRQKVEVTITDTSAILWRVQWPFQGTVQYLVNAIIKYLCGVTTLN